MWIRSPSLPWILDGHGLDILRERKARVLFPAEIIPNSGSCNYCGGVASRGTSLIWFLWDVKQPLQRYYLLVVTSPRIPLESTLKSEPSAVLFILVMPVWLNCSKSTSKLLSHCFYCVRLYLSFLSLRIDRSIYRWWRSSSPVVRGMWWTNLVHKNGRFSSHFYIDFRPTYDFLSLSSIVC